MNKPKFAKVNKKKYLIDTDFRTALKCNEIATDETISDYERAFAIVYLLFGKEGIEDKENRVKLLELGIKYLSFGKNSEEIQEERKKDRRKYELDFKKCKGLIQSSFKFDYNYDPWNLDYLHWYDFYNDLENLSSNEYGTCCVLNRVNEILNRNPTKIKDSKLRTDTIEAQKQLSKLYCFDKKENLTEEEKKNNSEFWKEINQK